MYSRWSRNKLLAKMSCQIVFLQQCWKFLQKIELTQTIISKRKIVVAYHCDIEWLRAYYDLPLEDWDSHPLQLIHLEWLPGREEKLGGQRLSTYQLIYKRDKAGQSTAPAEEQAHESNAHSLLKLT